MSLYVKGLSEEELYRGIKRCKAIIDKSTFRLKPSTPVQQWLRDYEQELENRIENILLGGNDE